MRHESDGDWMVTNEDGTPATRNTEENSDETTIGQAAMATPAMTSKQQPKPMTQEEKTFLMEQKEGGRILRGEGWARGGVWDHIDGGWRVAVTDSKGWNRTRPPLADRRFLPFYQCDVLCVSRVVVRSRSLYGLSSG